VIAQDHAHWPMTARANVVLAGGEVRSSSA
jgi:hypothetical protein